MTAAAELMAREEYDRLCVEIAGVAWVASRHQGEGFETTLLNERVTTATIRLAVVLTLATKSARGKKPTTSEHHGLGQIFPLRFAQGQDGFNTLVAASTSRSTVIPSSS